MVWEEALTCGTFTGVPAFTSCQLTVWFGNFGRVCAWNSRVFKSSVTTRDTTPLQQPKGHIDENRNRVSIKTITSPPPSMSPPLRPGCYILSPGSHPSGRPHHPGAVASGRSGWWWRGARGRGRGFYDPGRGLELQRSRWAPTGPSGLPGPGWGSSAKHPGWGCCGLEGEAGQLSLSGIHESTFRDRPAT